MNYQQACSRAFPVDAAATRSDHLERMHWLTCRFSVIRRLTTRSGVNSNENFSVPSTFLLLEL